MKRSRRVLVWVGIGVVGIGLIGYGPVLFGNRAAMEVDIQEKMLLVAMREGGAHGQRVELEVEGEPVTAELLARVRKEFPLAETGNDTTISASDLVYTETKDPAVIYEVDKFEWLAPWTVHIRVGYYCGMLCASHTTYKLSWMFGGWRIVGRGSTIKS